MRSVTSVGLGGTDQSQGDGDESKLAEGHCEEGI